MRCDSKNKEADKMKKGEYSTAKAGGSETEFNSEVILSAFCV